MLIKPVSCSLHSQWNQHRWGKVSSKLKGLAGVGFLESGMGMVECCISSPSGVRGFWPPRILVHVGFFRRALLQSWYANIVINLAYYCGGEKIILPCGFSIALPARFWCLATWCELGVGAQSPATLLAPCLSNFQRRGNDIAVMSIMFRNTAKNVSSRLAQVWWEYTPPHTSSGFQQCRPPHPSPSAPPCDIFRYIV